MAVTRIWPVKGQLSHPIDYVADKEKTKNPKYSEAELQGLKDVMNYAVNEEKTEREYFVSGINCNPAIARQQFVNVKKQFDKEGGIVAYHAYQSFAKGEVNPETAHDIGVEFAKRMWGEDYQVLVATHLNTKCLHNHFVINSVSFLHGKRCRKKEWKEISRMSDDICREFGISVIEEPKGKRLAIQLARAERDGKPTRAVMAKAAIDEAIEKSRSIRELEARLKSMGYFLQCRSDRKFWTIRQKDWDRPMRIAGLGDKEDNRYTNEAILKRLKEPKDTASLQTFHAAGRIKTCTPAAYKSKRRKGDIYNLYLHYCYLLGYLPKYDKSPSPNRVHYLLRDDLIKLDRITEETRLLSENHIETDEQLFSYENSLKRKMEELDSRRAALRNAVRRKGTPAEDKDGYRAEIDEISRRLGALRKEVRLCESIKVRSDLMEQKIEKVMEDEKRKEVRNHEFRR